MHPKFKCIRLVTDGFVHMHLVNTAWPYAFGFPVCIKLICIWEFRIAQMHLGSVSAMTPVCIWEICYWQYAFGNCSVDQMHMGFVSARILICIWEISYWQYAFRRQFHERNNMHLVIFGKTICIWEKQIKWNVCSQNNKDDIGTYVWIQTLEELEKSLLDMVLDKYMGHYCWGRPSFALNLSDYCRLNCA